jgi:MoaA/NifB/PqqE/SkfB family radical SAM enzyme
MYNLSEIKTVHLEITNKCQASCPMCARNMYSGIENPWLKETEITIEKFKEWFSVDFIKQLDRLYMCGNLGDAIVAKDTLEVFRYLREINNNIVLSLHTNGSARSSEWWLSLAELKVDVTFGIDGLVDTHHLYRVGTDFEKIIKNAKTFIDAGGEAKWHMLIFDHNKHQIEQCRQMSKELGFKDFAEKDTARFKSPWVPVLSKEGKTLHRIYPSEKSNNLKDKLNKLKEEIDVVNQKISHPVNCKVKQEKALYVAATGDVSPCCWLDFYAREPYNPSLVDFKDQGFITPNLHKQSLKDIFDSSFFQDIEHTWEKNPLRECSRQCSKIDRLKAQYTHESQKQQ